MIEVLPQSMGNVVALRVNGKLVHKDYEQFIPQLEKIIEQYGSLRCYFEMTEFDGISWRAMWDEMKFDLTHCNKIERCAIVGDPSWHEWMSKGGKAIFRWAQIENFTPDQTEEAWNWVTQDTEYAGAACGATQGTAGNTTGENTYGNTTGSCGTTTGGCGNMTGPNDNTCGNTPNMSNTTQGQTN
jgi:hypothetical protein